jgi:hypothetical protein
MSGPWQTPPAGSDLPPRNGNVQYYASRMIYPRNTITGGDWKVGREAVFQFESDPASGWLVPDQCKLYMRFKVKTKGGDTVPNTDSLRFAAAPLWGLFDAARWSMNGTTVQAVSGDLDSHAQLQLRMMGSRESHDTNGILGCDSLRQKMIHPELTSTVANTAAKGVDEVFTPEIIPNDKQKLFTDRKGTETEFELASPLSMCLTAFGTNKFIPGASHDVRMTIGTDGVNMRKSVYTERIPGVPIGQATVLGTSDANSLTLDTIAFGNKAIDADGVTALKTTSGTTDDAINYDATTDTNQQLARARMLARCTPPIAAYADAANAELVLEPTEVYLMAYYALPVHGTVPRPMSIQLPFDSVTLLTENISTKSTTLQLTVPVNTTRILMALRKGGTPALADNRELLGARGGSLAVNGSTPCGWESLSISIAGINLPAPQYSTDFRAGNFIRMWSDWQSYLKGSIGNTAGAQNMSEYQEDPIVAFRVIGNRDSVAQNLTVRYALKAVPPADTELCVYCIGTNVLEATYDDDASFQPTSVSVQEVI